MMVVSGFANLIFYLKLSEIKFANGTDKTTHRCRFVFALEESSFIFIREIQPDLTILGLECMEIRPRSLISELIINLLIEDQHLSVHIEDANEIRSPGIVFNEASNATTSFIPPKITILSHFH